MNNYTELRNEVLRQIRNRVAGDEVGELFIQLLFLIPEDDEVSIFLERRTAEELRKFKDCYAPLLKEIAGLCDIALSADDL